MLISINLLLLIFTIIYFTYILRFTLIINKLQVRIPDQKSFFVSLIIPARNEEANIGNCLESLLSQKYPADLYEIIVVNDQSTDNTLSIVEELKSKHPNIKLLNIPQHIKSSKKHCISEAIKNMAKGEIIITTDADCEFSEFWLKSMVSYFNEAVGMVIGLAALENVNSDNIFNKIQNLQYLGIEAISAAALLSGNPFTCQGCNLAFRKQVFEEVNGYAEENGNIAGEDTLLMHKVHAATDWQIKLAASPATIVRSKPSSTIKQFVQQQLRYAKDNLQFSRHEFFQSYKKHKIFLLSVFLYFILIVSVTLIDLFYCFFIFPAISLLLKLFVDTLFLFNFLKKYNRLFLLKYLIITEFINIFLVTFSVFASLFFQAQWKKRANS